MRITTLAAVLLCLLVQNTADACIWDRDTLAMERARFPEVNELIAGYFPRHSDVYYQWRLEQVLAIPEAQRTAKHYDDLGASYDKLGQHDKAIATMLEKIERFPDEGRYETFANLGTFHIHNGEYEQGVEYIKTAIEINPDAHFGREVYQKLLVEYVILKGGRADGLPLADWGEGRDASPDEPNSFAQYILDQKQIERAYSNEAREEFKKAIKGVLGMMRFGNYDSPILLEALGDLLIAGDIGENSNQQLAARAYLKASYEASDASSIEAYRAKATKALTMQENVTIEDVEAQLKAEIERGDAFFQQIVEDETAWVKANQDLDARFIKKYYEDPKLGDTLAEKAAGMTWGSWFELVLMALAFASVVFAMVYLIRKTRQTTSQPAS